MISFYLLIALQEWAGNDCIAWVEDTILKVYFGELYNDTFSGLS